MMRFHSTVVLLGCCLSITQPACARKSKAASISALSDYLQRNGYIAQSGERTPGSLWTTEGAFTNLATDYKARHVNDLIQIQILENTQAQSSGSVNTQRKFSADSGISALAGQINTKGIEQLFSPHSNATLQGKGQASTQSSLRSLIGGRVAAVFPNGNLVVEAERELIMNNEKQTVILRGMVRPGDIAPDNSVPSTSISNLELELKGKGVISDSTRPPNPLVRAILWLVGF
ncbi:MAG TPA: flagellar basal body L-ring protein FlgH [Terriglobales bacterium]|nr:flagellar basal body L-ring protein FlgH [Terriglobales bacterium]